MKNRLIAAVCMVFLCLGPSIASAEGNGLGIKASTLGAGVEFDKAINEYLGIRLGLNYFQYDSTVSVDDIEYDSSVNLQSGGAIVDWYPFAGAFRLTGGIMLNGNDGDVSATPDKPVYVGDTVYTPQQVGTLSGSFSFDTLAPYAGIGWTSNRDKGEGLSFAFDIGVLFQGAPSIDNYHASGPIADNPGFQLDIDKEVTKLEDDLDSFRYYPVVALTLMYRF